MRGEQQVPWASRTDSPRRSSQTPRDPTAASGTRGGKDKDGETTFFSPSERRYDDSPFPMSPETQAKVGSVVPSPSPRPPPPALEKEEMNTAPAEMLQPHRRLSQLTDGPHTLQQQSFDIHSLRPVAPAIAGNRRQLSEPQGIELDRSAPFRAMRDPSIAEAARRSDEAALLSVPEEGDDSGKGKATERLARSPDAASNPVTEGDSLATPSAAERAQDEGPTWGESFRVEWLRTERLPFTRTRHLRNPWNHDREVKVSRDGTELEPSVGQALLEEWDKPAEDAQPQASSTGNVEVGRRLQGRASVSADVLSSSTQGQGQGRKGEGS